MKKFILTIVSPLIGGILGALIVVLFSSGLTLGGVTNLDSLTLGDNLIVGGTITSTGTFTASGGSTFSGGDTRATQLVDVGTKTTLTATSTAQTLTAAQMCNNNFIAWDVSGTSSTLTFDSAENLQADCLTAVGDIGATFYIENLSGSGENITLVAGTNNELLEPSGGDVILEQNEWAKIEVMLTLASSSDSTAIISATSHQDAD